MSKLPSAAPGQVLLRRRSKRNLETEKKFLDAGNKVFWTNGFAGSTIAQIVETSDLSTGSFYHLFSDKKQLLDQATIRLLEEFKQTFSALDLSRTANGDLYTMFYHLALAGRGLVANNRGIYRATSELSQSNINGYGPLRTIGPAIMVGIGDVINDYADQLTIPPTREDIAYVVQLITMCVMHTELGMGPLFPAGNEDFAQIIARAACGILRYSGQADQPMPKVTKAVP